MKSLNNKDINKSFKLISTPEINNVGLDESVRSNSKFLKNKKIIQLEQLYEQQQNAMKCRSIYAFILATSYIKVSEYRELKIVGD